MMGMMGMMGGLAPWMRCARRIAVTGATVAHQLAAGARAAVDPAAGLSQAFVRLAREHALTVDVSGELPRGPCVLVANHVSYLDPIALLALVPARPLCKGEVGRWPLIGAVARARGVLLVDRACPWSGARVLRAAIAALRAGDSVLNFPEGTTTRGDQVLPFRRGIFGAARLARVPIVPVALRYADPESAWVGDETFVPHYLRTASKERVDVHVAFGAPIWPGRRAAAELAADARQRILTELERSHHVAAERIRVPETRPDPVLPAAVG
jgi:lyso-ornithine lipid O-acyltransferase